MARNAKTKQRKKLTPETAVSIGKQPRSMPSETPPTENENSTSTGKQPRKPIHPTHLKKGRKPRRWRPGTKALREIKRYQTDHNLLLRKLPFQRLVRELLQNERSTFRMTADAVLALQVIFSVTTLLTMSISFPLLCEWIVFDVYQQEASEAYVVNFFHNAQLAAIHRSRITVEVIID